MTHEEKTPMPSRRSALVMLSATAFVPGAAFAGSVREITWDDLIPPGVPYSEIIAEGEMDEMNDTWKPVFDANATKLNPALNRAHIRMPGFIVPLEYDAKGVTEFILVPYTGACVHTPPPPANQLVLVTTQTPWSNERLWAPVWVTGQMRTQLQSTELAEIGYALIASHIEDYEYD